MSKHKHNKWKKLGGCPLCGHIYADKFDRAVHVCKVKVKNILMTALVATMLFIFTAPAMAQERTPPPPPPCASACWPNHVYLPAIYKEVSP